MYNYHVKLYLCTRTTTERKICCTASGFPFWGKRCKEKGDKI